MTGRFLFWLLLAWPTPALIAGALGWKGVWGSGSALADYLIPIPVAGGVFHAMTFAGVTAVLLTQKNWPAFATGLARGVLLATSIVGAWLLFDFERHRLLQNPIGLFLFTDGLIAQLFVGAFGGRSPATAKEWLGALLAAAVLPAIAIGAMKSQDPRSGQQFVHTGSRSGPGRADGSHFVFTKLPLGSPEFRPGAVAFTAQMHIEYHVNTEDFAFYFFTNLPAAQMQDERQAAMTYCVYQDGTPSFWQLGKGDCFSDHENTQERFQKFFDAQERQVPQDERIRLAKEKACEGVKPQATDNAISSYCPQKKR